jgi:hypothetical protein
LQLSGRVSYVDDVDDVDGDGNYYHAGDYVHDDDDDDDDDNSDDDCTY